MVRSPGPVTAGFGLDGGEVFVAPCRRCFIGYLVSNHYSPLFGQQCVNQFEYRRDKLRAFFGSECIPPH